eukprot:TRINITY_DN49575_c0_g1_i1.p1 TRINITY_DN49575_c0_g1~~TRINITY_DN49575_c0_g1_i1.p1  ORF type:complete len:276 (-),score=83.30 TRINITY_DN49575_c0_g1_i1:116-943(-)
MPLKKKKVLRKKRLQAAEAEPEKVAESIPSTGQETAATPEASSRKSVKKRKAALSADSSLLGQPEKEDRRGIIHLASLPLHMRAPKLRHLLEQFGEVQRIYLAPEDQHLTKTRKKLGRGSKVRFTEGWVEFADRKLARRVADSLHGTPVGGKKRHNVFRDDLWNMRYLPKFKWHQLKEGTIYNQQVRKARLEQKLSQATRENTFFLEKVEQAKAKERIAERRRKKGKADPDAAAAGIGGDDRFGFKSSSGRRTASGSSNSGPAADISDKVLFSLF